MAEIMKNAETINLLQQVAGKHGVDGETVRHGIREAMLAAQRSENETARAFWKTIPEDATELDVVLHITRLLCAC
ncbi:MAG: hypothetical protein J6I98_05830, partial [Clostridia bacterium]|nr:hypothetical protein [Clostridia bacterium]